MKQRVVTGELFRDAENMKGEKDGCESYSHKHIIIVDEFLRAVTRGCITVRTPRPQGHIFWELVVLNFSDKEWKEHFRMSKTTFNYIADEPLVNPNTNYDYKIYSLSARFMHFQLQLTVPFRIFSSTRCVSTYVNRHVQYAHVV